MKKKENMAGVYNIYCPYDKVSKRYLQLYYATTDENFIRMYLPSVIMLTPLRDLTIYKVGVFNNVTGEVTKTTFKKVQTDCYLFPHSRLSPVGENESIDNIEKEIIKTKAEIQAKEEVKENE